jgi:Ca2+-binding RTX toxin-like protein
MATILGTEYNDNNTVNGNGQLHPALVGNDWEFEGKIIRPADDNILGFEGNDIIYGRGGSDNLIGGSGSDRIYGDNGSNSSFSLSGNDYLYGEAGDDDLYGEAGNDIIYGGTGSDEIFGGTGNDVIRGDENDDFLFGGTGNDILLGGDNNDYVDGANVSGGGTAIASGNEFDILIGGTGSDRFILGNINGVYYLGNGYATITDFNITQADTIQINGNFANGYALQLGNWVGTATQDTGILFNNNIIGIIQDQNITNLNLNQVFISPPPIPG